MASSAMKHLKPVMKNMREKKQPWQEAYGFTKILNLGAD